MTELLVEDRDNGILIARINRPDRMNAINHDLIAALGALFDRLDADPRARVLILTGAGRAFCAGADLKSDFVENAGPEHSLASQLSLARLMERIANLRQPVIAAVNGAAMGGGFAFTLAADIRIAGRSAKFGIANARLGLSAGECGISWLLPRTIGLSRAFELMLTGRNFDAEEAERIGYVLRVVEDDALIDAALETARLIAANAPFGVAMTKDIVRRNLETSSMQAAIALEARTQLLCGQSGAFREAVSAFLEKRPADFSKKA
ncbi:enoyl-CoA hydratase/isomerase family protein [soil metagenome]